MLTARGDPDAAGLSYRAKTLSLSAAVQSHHVASESPTVALGLQPSWSCAGDGPYRRGIGPSVATGSLEPPPAA